MPERNRIADAVRRLRLQNRLTQVELARRAGIPRASLALMESPRGNPSMTSVLQVAEALGISIDDLLSFSAENPVTLVNRDVMSTQSMDEGRFTATLLSPPSSPRVQIFSMVLRPGCVTSARIHPQGSQNYFYCATGGDVVLAIQDVPVTVHAGELAHFPGHMTHRYANPGKEDVHAFAVVVE